MIGDRYEDVPADIAYRNLVEGEDAFERAVERQEERTALMYEQQPEPDADDVIDAAVIDVECAREAEAEAPGFDKDGYPTEATLATIREWPYGDYLALIDYVSEAVNGYGSVTVQDSVGILEEPVKKVFLVTGGWSGNEDIVRALLANTMFWLTCWESTHRGGLVVLEIPLPTTEEEL